MEIGRYVFQLLGEWSNDDDGSAALGVHEEELEKNALEEMTSMQDTGPAKKSGRQALAELRKATKNSYQLVIKILQDRSASPSMH